MRTKKRRVKVGGFLGSILLIMLILGSLGWVYRSSWMTSALEIQPAQAGSIDHTVQAKAVFANEESLIYAPVSGKVEYLGKDGQRFRRGESVALVHPEGAAPGTQSTQGAFQITAPGGGLLYRKVDGLEGLLTPQNLLVMDLAKVLGQTENPQIPKEGVQAGVPIGKIVNNLSPTEAFVELKPTGELNVGKTIKLSIGGQVQSAKILRKSDNPQGLVVRFNQYIESSENQRIQNVDWIASPAVNGIVIPKSALWTKGEEQGVYVVVEGIIQFRQVKVLDENNSFVCVDNLPQGIPVIKNPRSGIEGLTAKVKIPASG